jgi:hypothetical protein
MIEGSCHCGAVHWRFDSVPESATACSCTVCRRYGALWIYGYDGEDVSVSGPTKTYARAERSREFHFCPECGCVAYWRGLVLREGGRRRMGLNVRLAEPERVADIPVRRFDGFSTGATLPNEGRLVGHVWF